MLKTISSLFICFLVTLYFSNCSRKIDPEGSFQTKAVTVDAELNDWSLPLRFGNKTGTIQYSVTNDKENVYIALLSRDEGTEQKILRMGMTIYFDPAGTDNKTISVNYPLKNAGGPKNEDSKERSANALNVNQKSRKQEMILQSSAFTITGFQHLENRSYELNEKRVMQLALKINDDNSLVYEAAVPIRNILGHPLTVNDPKKNFSVGIIIKGFQRSDEPVANAAGRTGGVGRGGMGGGRGMGVRGGMGGSRSMGGGGRSMGGSTDRTALLKDDVNWYKFRLAGS